MPVALDLVTRMPGLVGVEEFPRQVVDQLADLPFLPGVLALVEVDRVRVRLFFVEYFSPISRAFLTTDEPSPVRFRGDGFRPAAHRTVHPPSSGAPRRLAPAPLVLDSA